VDGFDAGEIRRAIEAAKYILARELDMRELVIRAKHQRALEVILRAAQLFFVTKDSFKARNP